MSFATQPLPIMPLTPAAFTVEVLNSASNDLVRLWRLEARIDTYLSVVSPARTRPQMSTDDDESPQPIMASRSPPPVTYALAITSPAASTDAIDTTTSSSIDTAARGRGRATGKKSTATKKSSAKSAKASTCTGADTGVNNLPSLFEPAFAPASSMASPPLSSDPHQPSANADLDMDLDFECHIETIERLPASLAEALTLGNTPRGPDMDKIKLYGILAVSYLATSALFKVVQPFVSVQEYFAQRFLLSRTQLARILNAAQVILDLSATPRDPADLVPFPLSLDVAGAVYKYAGPSRQARRALWSAVLLTTASNGGNDDGATHEPTSATITRKDVEHAMQLVLVDGIQYYLDAASAVSNLDVSHGPIEPTQGAADENQPQVQRPVKGVRYRDLELANLSSSSPAFGAHRFHPYARRALGQAISHNNKHEYMTPPDTPANALLHGAGAAAPSEQQDNPTPAWMRDVPGAAAMDDVDPMDVEEDADMAEDTPSIMSPPRSPAVTRLSTVVDHSESVLFGSNPSIAPAPPFSAPSGFPAVSGSSRQRGSSAVSIDLLVAAADFVEQQERRASVSSTGTSAPPLSPTAVHFAPSPVTRSTRGPPQYPIEFVTLPLGGHDTPPPAKPSSSGRAKSPLSLEFSTPAAKAMMPSPSPSPVHAKADELANALVSVNAATPEPCQPSEGQPCPYSSVATTSPPPRPMSSSLFGVIATSSSSQSPSPVSIDHPGSSSASALASKPIAGGLLENCEA